MNSELNAKYKRLKAFVGNYKSAIVAYSGGLDSAFLATVTTDVLNKKALCVTAVSETYPKSELYEALRFAKKYNLNLRQIKTLELNSPEFKANPHNRCYFCKKELFSKLNEIMKNENYSVIFDGTNADDLSDHRPGMLAAKEFNVQSPLKEVALTKNEIRTIAKKLELEFYNKPQSACLSSRIPYGDEISESKLKMIENAEIILKKEGFRDVRVRTYNKIARIEVGPNEIDLFMNNKIRQKIIDNLKKIGYIYVTLDLEGYRQGSMNVKPR